MRGLKNLGNTCYFNAAVQCLAHVPTLAQHLLLNDYTGLCSITFEYQKVLRKLLLKGINGPVDPNELLDAFRERFPEFEERKQHDSQEVVLKLMDVFEKSIGLKVFNGRENGQPMTSLLVPVLEPCSLGDLIEGHVVEEWPQIISFTFMMYDHKFPVVLPFQFMQRNLFAVIMHKGDAEEGHYALLVKVRNTWYIKEDEKVYEIPYQIELMRGEFYMAFYRPDNLLK
jgi:ubiquitin C-terminal hydrolase